MRNRFIAFVNEEHQSLRTEKYSAKLQYGVTTTTIIVSTAFWATRSSEKSLDLATLS